MVGSWLGVWTVELCYTISAGVQNGDSESGLIPAALQVYLCNPVRIISLTGCICFRGWWHCHDFGQRTGPVDLACRVAAHEALVPG
jgi:hypothetical protein